MYNLLSPSDYLRHLDGPDTSSSCHKALVSLNIKKAYKPYPEDDPFYYINATPAALAAYKPGHILSYRSIELTPFPGIDGTKLKTWQVAYVYTDADDKAAVSVFVVIMPNNSSKDRILLQLPKTDAAISECRTSYSLRKGSAARFASLSESPFMSNFLDQGWICVIPDYMGQQDAFGNGPLAGRCALDAARAVLMFGALEVQPDAKLAFWGYSSGAQAVGWAASQQALYAPELTSKIVGWAAGGLPGESKAISVVILKSDRVAIVFAIVSNSYPALKQWLEASLTPAGKKLYGKAAESCFGGFMFASFLKDVLGTTYFRQERPLEEALPRKILDQLNLDRPESSVPSQPMLILGSLHDEVVPTADLDNLVDHWAQKGASIEYIRDRLSKHVTLCFTGFPPTLRWLQKRFDGEESHSKPGQPYIRTKMTTKTAKPRPPMREKGRPMPP
ncbi:LIP-domain-containing protein [Microstroma glucosiphilum]|uniref:triacylglycerol lipase n=1 Tax=Pseudomicrostroma glucosiphilum TaxID=1684307 RepID=A0A316UFQ3_9BASI|nr:LIP-domain-containing protein [Pseudomicrostroma glucosiphilum]PWN24079.1 LIP-domain-containing protein [Pseudomicrostroma glucosiphilum]